MTPADILTSLDEATREWATVAALGGAPWVCADCGASYSDGMPNQCAYGHERCNDILKRDKAKALDSVRRSVDGK